MEKNSSPRGGPGKKEREKEASERLKAKLGLAPHEKNREGRPKAILPDEKTIDELKNLARIGATQDECAMFFGIHLDTFKEFINRYDEARTAYDGGRTNFKVSLRRSQFKSALEGNVTMQIWLGKQYLGQKDKHEIEQKVNFTFNEMSKEELVEYVNREIAELGVGHAETEASGRKRLTR